MKKEIPILLSIPMVQAILEGRKTQTRRIIKPQPSSKSDHFNYNPKGWPKTPWNARFKFRDNPEAFEITNQYVCRYGKVGDLLWVRETMIKNDGFTYWPVADGYKKCTPLDKVVPSIHVPKIASRIWLEITDIRVERLHDISEDDAMNEGVELVDYNCFRNYLVESDWQYDGKNQKGYHMIEDPKGSFASLWHKINGEESWNANPWVWVIEFKVLSTTGKPQIKELEHAH